MFPSRWLLALVLSTIVATRASAEPPPAAPAPAWRGAALPEQWRPGVPESAALRVPTPITSDEEVERVTLKQAIGIALENNPGIAAQRLEPPRQREGILQAEAQYDPSLFGEIGRASCRERVS